MERLFPKTEIEKALRYAYDTYADAEVAAAMLKKEGFETEIYEYIPDTIVYYKVRIKE